MKRNICFLILSCTLLFGCGKSDATYDTVDQNTNSEDKYTESVSTYIDDGFSAYVDENNIIYEYEDDSGNKKELIIDASGDDSSAEERVKQSVVRNVNAKVTDEIIDVASKLENANKVSGIDVHLAKNDHDKHDDLYNDHIEDLDLSKIKLKDVNVKSIYDVDDAMFHIWVQSEMNDDEFSKFTIDLKDAIIKTYDATFPFDILRM